MHIPPRLISPKNTRRPTWAWLLVVLVCLGILGVGFNRAAPIELAFGETSIVMRQRYLWSLVVVASLTCAYVGYRKFAGYVLWHKVSLLVSLAIAYFLMTVVATRGDFGYYSSWNTFYVSPDSLGYVKKPSENSVRPPLYPMFVNLIIGNEDDEFDFTALKTYYGQPIATPDHPLLKVVRAQKVFLLISSLAACAALMTLIDPSLSAVFFLLIYDGCFLSHEIDVVLSETLTQGWLLLLLAVFLLYVKSRHSCLLPIGALLSAFMFLTRPAGAYGIVLWLSMLLIALRADWRRNWKAALASAAVLLLTTFSPLIYRFLQGEWTVSIASPMYAYSRTAFALQVAKAQDVDWMPDETARRYLISALEIKRAEQMRILSLYPEGSYAYVANLLASNLWVVNEYALRQALPGKPLPDQIRLMQTVSQILLRHHWQEYYRFAWNSFKIMASQVTRLNINHFLDLPLWLEPVLSFWGILLLCLAAMVFLRNQGAYIGLTLIATHLVALIIIVLSDAPSPRYVYASEFLVLIAALILGWGVFEKMIQLSRARE